MTPTSILARIHKWKIDELRREISALEDKRQAAQMRVLKLDGDLEDEAHSASGNLIGTFAFTNFAMASKSKRGNETALIAELDGQIDQLRDQLNLAFQELKRYEIAEESRQSREAAEIARKEQIDADELGLEGHRRRQAHH